ncbi:MAG: response regulator [Elusimicrobia bacterium]|nr:response regulator [Elusimicrobiota bacterium]
MKALIVEDNSLTRTMLKTLLEQLKWEVVGEAEDGKEAVKAFTELRPEVVFLDLILPGKSGMEVLEELRKIDPGAKVVIITAVEQDEINKMLSDRGAAVILRKPFSYEEFRKIIGGLTPGNL